MQISEVHTYWREFLCLRDMGTQLDDKYVRTSLCQRHVISDICTSIILCQCPEIIYSTFSWLSLCSVKTGAQACKAFRKMLEYPDGKGLLLGTKYSARLRMLSPNLRTNQGVYREGCLAERGDQCQSRDDHRLSETREVPEILR